MQFGFTCTETIEGPVFSNENLKPLKLREHFNNWHGGADVSGHNIESLKA